MALHSGTAPKSCQSWWVVTGVERLGCCLWFHVLQLFTSVQRKFSTKYHKKKSPQKNEYFSVTICSLKLAVHLPQTNRNRHQLSGHAGKLALTKVTARYGHKFHFSTRWGTPALPWRRYFPPQLHGCGLAWTWWDDSLGTMIAWLTLQDFLVWGYVKDKIPFHILLQVWKNYGHE
jgi:hypothetical protein